MRRRAPDGVLYAEPALAEYLGERVGRFVRADRAAEGGPRRAGGAAGQADG